MGLWQRLVALSGWDRYKAAMKHRFKPEPVDARQFNDPKALQTRWEPLQPTGLLFPKRLRSLAGEGHAFKLRRLFVAAMLLGPLVFAGAFHHAGPLLALLLAAPPAFAETLHRAGRLCAAFLVVVGYPLILGVWLLDKNSVVFDQRKGVFRKSRWRCRQSIPLNDIQALQLLSFFHQNGRPSSGGVVYQLNLVLTRGRRVEAFSQRRPILFNSRAAVIQDVHQLAEVLDVPAWDAIASYDR